jgi:hypothetical protein
LGGGKKTPRGGEKPLARLLCRRFSSGVVLRGIPKPFFSPFSLSLSLSLSLCPLAHPGAFTEGGHASPARSREPRSTADFPVLSITDWLGLLRHAAPRREREY